MNNASGNVVGQWVTASQAGCGSGTGTCALTPGTALATGPYTWWVLGWNPIGAGPWSAGVRFTVSP